MAQKWNDRNLLKLLLLAVTEFKGNFAELALQWAKRYPDEEFQPTARAIQEKIKTLKKAVDASSTIAITGSKWSEDHLLKLLMLAMTNIKSNYAELATQWAKRYREILTEAAMAHPRAIEETLKSLKKSVEASSSSSPTKSTRAPSNPSTPKKRAAPKSFVNTGSSSKRAKQFDALNFSIDSDDNADLLATPNGRSSMKSDIRRTPTRKSKSTPVNHSILADETSNDNNEGGVRRYGSSPTAVKVEDLGRLPIGDSSAGLIKPEDGDIIVNSRHVAGGSGKDSFTYFDQLDYDNDVSNFIPGED